MDGLHGWISSPTSLLYDSAVLQKSVLYMKRVFKLLLGEMRKHGAQIIYATPTRVIISTGKVRPQLATNTSLSSYRELLNELCVSIQN